MSALSVFVLVVAALLVLAALVTAVVGVWLGRWAVRGARVVNRQYRVTRAGVRASMPSPAQDVYAQGVRIERELAATGAAWDTGRRDLDRRTRRRLAHHHEVLVSTGRRLAFEVSLAAAETDPARRDAWLPDLRFRVDALVVACGQFRQGVLLAGSAYGDAARVVDVAVATALAER